MKGAQLIQCHNCGRFHTEHQTREEFGKHYKQYSCPCGSFIKIMVDGNKMMVEVWERGDLMYSAKGFYDHDEIMDIYKEESPYRTLARTL